MSRKSERYAEIARDLADRFEASGDKFSANQALTLARAFSSYATTLSQLHKDNMALRNANPLPPYPKARSERVSVRADLLEHAARLIHDRDPKLANLFERLSQEAAA